MPCDREVCSFRHSCDLKVWEHFLQFLFFLPDLAVRGDEPGGCVDSILPIAVRAGLFSSRFGELLFPLLENGSLADFSGELVSGLVRVVGSMFLVGESEDRLSIVLEASLEGLAPSWSVGETGMLDVFLGTGSWEGWVVRDEASTFSGEGGGVPLSIVDPE